MKKVLLSIMVVVLASFIACTSCMASAMPYFDVIHGQKMMMGDVGEVVDFLSSLTRQQLIDLSIIDKGTGMYYARVLSEDSIMTWSDGTDISAYTLSDDMPEYNILQNGFMLMQGADGDVSVVQDVQEITQRLDDMGYPEAVYATDQEALYEEYLLKESYPNASYPFDTLAEVEGFEKQEMFKALVLAYRWSEKYDGWVYFMAWKVINIPQQTVDTYSPSSPVKPDTKPTATPKPGDDPTHSPARPTPTPKPSDEKDEFDAPTHSPARPTATPRVSDEEDQFEHSTPKPTVAPTQEPTSAPTQPPSHSQADEDYVASHSEAKPSSDEGVIQRDPEDAENYTAQHSQAKPSSDKNVITRDPEDEAAASHSSSSSSSSHSSESSSTTSHSSESSSSSSSSSSSTSSSSTEVIVREENTGGGSSSSHTPVESKESSDFD